MSDVIDTTALASYLRLTESDLDEGAEILVELTNGLIVEAVGDATEYPASVRAVALEVAARAYRNPDGYSSETVDDYTYRRDADTRQAGVYLTDTEQSRLQGGTGRVHVGWLA